MQAITLILRYIVDENNVLRGRLVAPVAGWDAPFVGGEELLRYLLTMQESAVLRRRTTTNSTQSGQGSAHTVGAVEIDEGESI
jgi:hypothetical protein